MSNVIAFPQSQRPLLPPAAVCSYPQRNRRNPLRRQLTSISVAVTMANRLEITPGEIDWIIEGAKAAFEVAERLTLIVKQMERRV